MWIDVFFDLRSVPVSLLILTANQKHVSSHLVLEHVLGMVGPWFHGRMDYAIWIWLKVRTDVGLGGVQLIEVPGLNEQSSISWFAKTSSGPTFPKSQMKEGSSGRSKVNLSDIYVYILYTYNCISAKLKANDEMAVHGPDEFLESRKRDNIKGPFPEMKLIMEKDVVKKYIVSNCWIIYIFIDPFPGLQLNRARTAESRPLIVPGWKLLFKREGAVKSRWKSDNELFVF